MHNLKLAPADLSARFLASTDTEADFTLIDQLCRDGLGPDRTLAKASTRAIFDVIEYLCDDFSDFGVHLTGKVLVRMLHHIRSTPEGKHLHTLLNDFGFINNETLLRRYQTMWQRLPISMAEKKRVKKILILSRVTAGADIAITDVIAKRLSLTFADATLVFIGPSHLSEMFDDIPRASFIPFIYKNDGTLFVKMTSWPALLSITQTQLEGYALGEVLLFDTDSRLSQLGLLPLIPDRSTYLFPSRASQPRDLDDKNLSFLANRWLDHILSEQKIVYPRLRFTAETLSRYTHFNRVLKAKGCRFIVTINFGVGNDPSKKIEDNFEEALISRLLKTPETVVVLDTGRGQSEGRRVEHLLRIFSGKNIQTGRTTAGNIRQIPTAFSHGLLAFKGPLGELGKMIDATDCFIGYDSCGQHLAGATRTPAVIIFAGAPSPRFIRRWAPTNKENITIPVNTKSLHSTTSLNALLDQVEAAVNTIRSKTSVPDQ